MGQATAIVPEYGVRARYNGTGSDIAANVAVMLDSTSKYIKLPSSNAVALHGVTRAAIANGKWGDVQVSGVALVKASGALATPGIQLMSDTAGKAVTFAAASGVNAQVLGQLLTTGSALNDLVEVELLGLGTIQQGQ